MKKLFPLFFIVITFFLWPKLSLAQNNSVNLHLFFSPGCPHCAAEKEFLKESQDKYPQLNIIMYDVGDNVENQKLYAKVAEKLGVRVGGVPFTVICDEYILGYLSPETTGKQIDTIIQEKIESGVCNDEVSSFQSLSEEPQVNGNKDKKNEIDLPVFGLLDLETTSLFFLTAAIGFLDGFNPCAMWTLLFLISLLLGIKDKKRRYFLGTAFILASGLVYFAFMAAWLNFFLLLGFVKWVRLTVAGVAIGVGIYNFKNFWQNRQGGCFVEGDEKRQQKFEQIKQIVYKKNILLSIGGIILLAFAVNMIELVCSAGFPAIYTQILAMSDLNTIQYYLYLLLYIFFFILDDLAVFVIAMITVQAVGIENKYSQISKVIGGILMILIGLLLIFNPQLLTFG